MTYDAATAYLERFVNYEHAPQPKDQRALTLDRMRQLCQRLFVGRIDHRLALAAGPACPLAADE